MPDRRDRSVDVYMRDGLLKKGKVVGHADARGRIRDADSSLRKGVELGYVDDKERVRRKSGFLRRGDVVGRIRGNAAYVGEGLLGGGLKVGFVDELGNVWQSESQSFRSRAIGRAKGADPETALAYFMLKFCEIEDAVAVLEEKVRESEERYAFLPRVRGMQRVLPEVDALGDHDALVRRLEQLEDLCASDLGHQIREQREVLDEAVRRRPTPESIVQSLRADLNLSHFVPEQADALVDRLRGAIGGIADARRPRDDERRPGDERRPPEARYEDRRPRDEGSRRASTPPPPSPVPPAEREERGRRVDQLLELTFGSVDRVRDELDRIRRDPTYGPDDLVDSMRSAMTSMRDAGERLVTDGARPRKRDSVRPPAPLPAPAAPAVEPRPPSTALVKVEEPDASTSRAFAENLMKSSEAEQVFELIDVGIERLRELEDVRRDGLTRLSKALDFVRNVRRKRR